MPEVVPDIFVDYLCRLNTGGAGPNGSIPDELFIQGAQTVASISLGASLVPHDFQPTLRLRS